MIGFTGAGLDRADAVRLDPARLAALQADPRARAIVLSGLDPLLGGDGRLQRRGVTQDESLIFLGLDGDAPLFAPLISTPPVGERPSHLFAVIAQLAPGEAAIWGTARSLLEWHNRTRFCGVCGGRPEPFRAGWGRKCPQCGTEHFPRVDPVVIMIAEHDGRALLGRQPRFPAGRYSALAGFLEPGESIEEAVARELAEEAGVVAREVRYLTSQPWPFPHQLMIGCVAAVESDRLAIDGNELEDARWFTREEVLAALEGKDAPFIAPPAYALAHTLMRMWVGLE